MRDYARMYNHDSNNHNPLLLLRFSDLVAAGIVRNRMTLWRWINAGEFPRPMKIGPNSRAWRAIDIEAWLKSRAQATTAAGSSQ
jgi:prophage regulatory protein